MTTARMSWVIEDCKRKSQLTKWIDQQRETAIALAYANRRVIDKRDIEWDAKKWNYVPQIYDLFKKLRKKDDRYDCLIGIDRKGYITIQFIFPITQEELDKAHENKKKWIEEWGNAYSSCVRINEEVWKVCHERVNHVFKGFELSGDESYCKYGESPLIRWVDFVKC